MKKVQLRQLAVMSLGITYARSMGGNKLKHYTMNHLQMLIGQFSGQPTDNLEAVRQHIEQEEGEPVEIELLPTVYNASGMESIQGMQIKEVSDAILDFDPQVRAALEKLHVKSTLYQYNDCISPFKTKYLAPITEWINYKVLGPINSLLYRMQYPHIAEEFKMATEILTEQEIDAFDAHINKKSLYRSLLRKIKQIPLLPAWGYVRKVTPVSFLTVVFQEDEIEQAVETLLADLRLLEKNGLIMGHLAMPSLILMADMIGSGKLTYALFCFPILDQDKLCKILKKSPLELGKHPFAELGVKLETPEGGANYLNGVDPKSKYEIEEVKVGPSVSDAHKVQVESYLSSREYVNKVAKEANELIENLEKVTSTTHDVEPNKVKVEVQFKGDSALVKRLNEKFKT